MMALSDLRQQQSLHQQGDWFQMPSSSSYAGPSGGQPDFRTVNLFPNAPPSSSSSTSQTQARQNFGFLDGIRNQVTEHAMQFVAQEAFNQAKQKTTGMGRYFSIDWISSSFQSYFAVDGKGVLNRMKASLLPFPQLHVQEQPDFYGPLMLVFTLAIFLVMCLKEKSMKRSFENTAMGTSLGVCFGYWYGASAIFLAATYLTDTRLNVSSILCTTGYSMTSYLVILSVAYVMHSSTLFWCLFFTAGLLSAASLARTFKEFTPDNGKGITVSSIVVVVHLLYLVYLRTAFLALA